MKNNNEVNAELERLWNSFDDCRQTAGKLDTPNPEDDLFSKLAITGFSHYDTTENWTINHFQITRQYLEDCKNSSQKCREFTMLAIGSLLGLYSSEQISTLLYHRSAAILPGFIAERGEI